MHWVPPGRTQFSVTAPGNSPQCAVACGLDNCLTITACTVPVPCAGTLFWLLASNSYPDYDGYTVYTSKVAVQQPAPAWPQLSPELVDAVGLVQPQE